MVNRAGVGDNTENCRYLFPPYASAPAQPYFVSEVLAIVEGSTAMKSLKGEPDYTITEAFTLVRDAALEGRRLEAWCEEWPSWTYRFVLDADIEAGEPWEAYLNGQFDSSWNADDTLWATNQILDAWHVREVVK
jgi:hypothetical protein